MGKGLVRAVAATVKKTNVILVRQPDDKKVVVQCQACGIAQTYELPSDIPGLTRWLKQVEKAHKSCKPTVALCSHGKIATICSICEGHPA